MVLWIGSQRDAASLLVKNSTSTFRGIELSVGTRSWAAISLLAAVWHAHLHIPGILLRTHRGDFRHAVRADIRLFRREDGQYFDADRGCGLCVPTLVVYVLVVLILRPTAIATWMNGALIMLIAFLSVNWVSIARLVRASVLKLKKLEFVEAAQSIGARPWRIIRKHILPNSMSPILVWITYSIPQFILVEAILGYLGVSLSPTPDETLAFGATWGVMLREGRAIIHVQPIMTIAPAVCLALISIAFTLLGDAMRDSLDPGLNEKKEHPEI